MVVLDAAPAVIVPEGADPARLREYARQELARRRLLNFVQFTKPDYVAEAVHRYVAGKLQAFVEACERRESPRLILQMAPQHGKSQLSSRHLPAWVLGRHPEWRVMLMSYSADWAHDLAHDARDIVQSEAFQKLWPNRELDPTSTAVDDWGFSHKAGGGGMVAVGREGSATGRSTEILLIDDPVKNRKEADSESVRNDLWKEWPSFRNRVQRGGGVLIVATRWHHDDLIGRLLEWQKDHQDADQYEVINLEALAPEDDPLGRPFGTPLAPLRYDTADLLQLRASMGESDWQALYCGRPTAEQGAIFLNEWFIYEREPRKQAEDWVFLSADTAYSKERTADYSVIQAWRVEKAGYRLLDVYRKRVTFPELKRDVATLDLRWHPDALLVEDIGSGKSLAQELNAETRLPVIPWRPDRDKAARANAVTQLFAAGRVRFPNDAPWLRTYVGELLQFPAGAHDDQVDATTMALTWAREQTSRWGPTELKTLPFTYDAQPGADTSGLYASFGLRADEE